jgi:hypothetical protein
MDADKSRSIITAAGGDTKFARMLGLDSSPGFAQRVNNWKRRGIPSDVVLANLEEIRRLESLGNAPKRERSRPQSGTKRSVGR